MSRRLLLLLLSAAGLALLQQQWLLRRPPRLLTLQSQPIHSGSTALDLRFSRPMDRASFAAASTLMPALQHRWQGQNDALRLQIDARQAIGQPLQLQFSGTDQRGQMFPLQRWWWDPRPWLVVNRVLEGGEQLQLQRRDGSWLPLTPVWPAINQVEPLSDGRGIAIVSSDGSGQERIWIRRLQPRNLQRQQRDQAPPRLGPLQSLITRQLLFGHISSNLNGDLLMQTGGFAAGSETVELMLASGARQHLGLAASGPMQLLPAGGGVVVPSTNGLTIKALSTDNNPPQGQLLPGRRELGAFCPASGRAVLIRHWPDYRRSIELVVPGVAPRELHLGDEAVLAVACNNTGTRIWAVLGRWTANRSHQTIVLMDDAGTVMRRRRLDPWLIQPGTRLSLDSVGQQLLLTVGKAPQRQSGVAALMHAESLAWIKIGDLRIKEALWLQS